MAIRNIVKIGNDVLRERSKIVENFDDRLAILLTDMTDTMFKANGVGLAAPQVGILKRAVVISVDGETVYEMVNPVIKKKSGTQVGEEGCLSVPDRYGIVERPKKVIVEYYDRNGEKQTLHASGLLARAVCHELDHLDGVLYVDREIKESK
jgi:peptide deformylase